jgi:hypothetical protein
MLMKSGKQWKRGRVRHRELPRRDVGRALAAKIAGAPDPDYLTELNAFLQSVTDLDNSLLQRFVLAVAAFNAASSGQQDWTALANLLDDNVILNTLDPPTMIISKAAVIDYLQHDIAADEPRFTPLSPINVDATSGRVWGRARWLDHDNGTTTDREITYSFTFVLHNNDNAWYIVNMWGSPD